MTEAVVVRKRAKTLPLAVPSTGMSTVNFTNEQIKLWLKLNLITYVYE